MRLGNGTDPLQKRKLKETQYFLLVAAFLAILEDAVFSSGRTREASN